MNLVGKELLEGGIFMGQKKQIALLLLISFILSAIPWCRPAAVHAGSYEDDLLVNWDLSSSSGLAQWQNVSFVNVAGVDAKVAKFSGTRNNTSYITLPNTAFSSVSAATGLTISLWFHADESTGEWSRLFDFGNSAFSSNPPFIFLTPGMKFSYNSNGSAWMQGEGTETFCDVYETIDVNYGVWNHAVVSLSATEISLYLNGNRVGGAENDNRKILNTLKQYNCFDLGRSKYTADPDYVGYMRDLSIYKASLTAEDVADLYKESGGTGAINTPSPYEPHDMDASKNSDGTIQFPSAPAPYSPDGNKRQWVHDPSLIKADDYYYMYSTGLIPGNADVEIRRSKDMINWEYVQAAGLMPANPEVASYIQSNLWAPEVYKYGNEYRMYYSCSGVSGGTSCIALAVSSKPEGPFTHKGIVVRSTNSGWSAGGVNAIDANIICDTSGKMYMVWGSFFGGIKIAEMDAATGYLKSSDKNSDSTPGTIIAKRPQGAANDNGACEGPFVFYSEETGYYYLVVSYGNLLNEDRGAGSYNMRMGRSRSITGPYLDYNGKNMTDVDSNFFEVGYKLATNHKFNNSGGWMCIGGNSVYKEDGKYWCVAHARQGDGSQRDGLVYLNIRQLFWTEDGWPLSNPSLYAGEKEQKVPVEYVPGKYERIEFSYTKEGKAVTAKTLQLYPDYTVSVGSTNGIWSYSGENIVTVTLGNATEKYKIVPSWDWEKNRATYTITGVNVQNGLQRWGKKIAYYNWTGENPPEPTASEPPSAAYKESMIYGFDFESENTAGKITPITESLKTGSAELKGSALIKTDPVRGNNVLYIKNTKGARSDSYLLLPSDVLTTVTSAGYTVSMWVNIGADTFGHSALFEANRSGTKDAWPMTRISANLIARINATPGAYSDTQGFGSTEEEKGSPFAVNEWHHISYSVSAEGIQLYLDGELNQSTSADLTNCFNSSLNDSIQKAVYTTIGSGRIFDDEDIHEAMFDNVAVYNKALSAVQIKQMYRDETKEEDPEPSAAPTRDPENPSETTAPTKNPENPSETTAPTKNPENPSETTAPTKDPDAPPVSNVPGDQVTTPSTNPVPSAALKGTVSLQEAGKAVMNSNTDKGDPKGSVFAVLRLSGKGGKKSIKLSWTKVKGADGYIVYGSACGKKMIEIDRLSAGKKSTTIKKLKKAKYYKYIVAAYKNIGGEMRVCAQSKSVHVCTAGGKTTNPVKITAKKKLVLKKGKTKKISAALKPAKRLKIHIAKFRYESTNTKIAAVDKKGRIKAKKKGTCKIYIYAQNGVYKTVKVTVK